MKHQKYRKLPEFTSDIKNHQKLPEKKCPECKGIIHWKVVRGGWGEPLYNGLCKKCNIIFRSREIPSVTEGKELQRNGVIDGTPVKNIRAMDDRILSLPMDVQLGILRERQGTIIFKVINGKLTEIPNKKRNGVTV